MLIAGNWKMNTDLSGATQLARAIVSAVADPSPVNVAVCPPFVSIDAVFGVLHSSRVRLGAQNLYEVDSGAYTGEISAPMLRSAGCFYVILGHSERRQYFSETDGQINARVKAAHLHRLVPIVCVGETLDERDAGREKAVVSSQLRGALTGVEAAHGDELVVAYEPVWAIGTGKTASPDQAQEMHATIRSILQDQFGEKPGAKINILYGGSMKPSNAPDLLSRADVDGGLIGGASLNADSFVSIVRSAIAVAG